MEDQGVLIVNTAEQYLVIRSMLIGLLIYFIESLGGVLGEGLRLLRNSLGVVFGFGALFNGCTSLTKIHNSFAKWVPWGPCSEIS
jgi:hypothetical protein